MTRDSDIELDEDDDDDHGDLMMTMKDSISRRAFGPVVRLMTDALPQPQQPPAKHSGNGHRTTNVLINILFNCGLLTLNTARVLPNYAPCVASVCHTLANIADKPSPVPISYYTGIPI